MPEPDKIYDVAVVGGGAAGSMAAIRSAEAAKRTVLIERNASIGKKLRMTGKGRCNVTNIADLDTFIEKFAKTGKFLRQAFYAFSNIDLMEFFKSKGLELVPERQGRVFPVDYKARSVIEILKKCLNENKVELVNNTRVISLEKKDVFRLELENKIILKSRKVILAAGGGSYKITGSTGDGFRMAAKLGHTIEPLRPALVPLVAKDAWVKDLQGIALKNVRATFSYDRKKIVSKIGEILFTHFGVSGPLILDLSAKIVELLEDHKEISLFIDLKPALTEKRIEEKMLEEFKREGSVELHNALKKFLPEGLIPVIIHLAGGKPEEKINQVTKKTRQGIVRLLKELPLGITGSLPLEEAMLTSGGVSAKEINPKTMESKIVPGLYFAGEIIEGEAPSGGYNLQQAFSTGFLAGESASHACNNYKHS